jgi:hypothetical protein
MLRTIIIALVAAFTLTGTAQAQCFPAWPNCLSNGTTADASKVMGNFNAAAPLASPSFTGNVGIGTTAPSETLHVYGTGAAFSNSSLTNYYKLAPSAGQTQLNIGYYVLGNWYPTPGTPAMTLTYNGLLGIGTAPVYSLDIGSGSGVQVLRLNGGNSGSSDGGTIFISNAGATWTAIGNYSAIYGTGYNNALTLYTGGANVLIPNGNVGIGTVSPYATLDIRSGTNERLLVRGASGGGTSIGSVNDANSLFQPVEIDGSSIALMVGNVGIGTTTPSYLLTVNGTAYASGAAGALSDIRHKTDVAPVKDGAIDQILKLRPVTFQWKDPKDDGMKGEQTGFIAQEVEKILPSVVLTQDNAEKTKGLKYNEIVAILTKAVQEQQAEIKQLRSSHQTDQVEITELKANQQAQIDTLRAQIAELTQAKVASLR